MGSGNGLLPHSTKSFLESTLAFYLYGSVTFSVLHVCSRYHYAKWLWKLHFLKGQWCRALMFSLICVWTSGWANNREAGDLRRYRTHYDVTVMGHSYDVVEMTRSLSQSSVFQSAPDNPRIWRSTDITGCIVYFRIDPKSVMSLMAIAATIILVPYIWILNISLLFIIYII